MNNFELKKYFIENRKELLELTNTDAGRFLLKIPQKHKIIKVFPNAVQMLVGKTKNKIIYQSIFYLDNYVAKKIAIPLLKMQIAKNEISKYTPRNLSEKQRYFEHYSGLDYKFSLPHVYLTTDTFNISSGSGNLRNRNADYTTCHDESVADSLDFGGTGVIIYNNAFTAGEYELWKGYIVVDTSSINDTGIIESAFYRHYVTAKTDFNSDNAVLTPQTQANDGTLSTDDWDQALSTTIWGSLAIGSITTSAYNNIPFNATGLSNISLVGNTKFALRVQREVDSVSPTGSNNKSEIQSDGRTGTNVPQLSVTWIINEEDTGGSYILS